MVVLGLFTLAFDSSPIKGEGDSGWLFWTCSPSPLIPLPSRERGIRLCCLVVTRTSGRPCGYCLEASMTTALWIPAYAGMTVRDARKDMNRGCFGLVHPHL